MKPNYTYPFLLLLFLTACAPSLSKIDARWAMDRNECGKLHDKVLVYAIFVDSKDSKFWTGYEMRTALDSLKRATGWIREQATGVNLELTYDYHNSEKGNKTMNKKLPEESMYKLFKNKPEKGSSAEKLNKWVDAIAKKAADEIGLPTEKDKKQKLQGLDRLTQMLKKKYGVRQAVVMIMLNDYYISDMSVSLNTMNDEYKEYCVSTNRSSLMIAQQILVMHGASILYKSSLEEKAGRVKEHELAKREFPDDVMVNNGRDISELEVGPLTRYLIGWDEEIDAKYEKLFFSNKKKKSKKAPAKTTKEDGQ